MFFGTGNGHIKQPALLLQLTVRIHAHRTGEKIFFHTHYEHILEFQSFGRMNRHQGNLRSFLFPAFVLISQQGNFRKIVAQQHMRVTFLPASRTEIMHTIHQLLYIFLPAQILRRAVLTNVPHYSRLAHDGSSNFISIFRNGHLNKGSHQRTESLQLRRSSLVQFHSVCKRLFQHRPQTHPATGCRLRNLAQRRSPDTTGRIIDDPFQRLLIMRIHCQTEIGKHILYLLTLIE